MWRDEIIKKKLHSYTKCIELVIVISNILFNLLRTNTYPKIPERFRLKSTDALQSVGAPHHENQSQQLRSPVTTRTYGNSDELENDGNSLAADEKVIYF